MKALSIRCPWWWFILHGGKDIENRDWYCSYRGPVLIHASKWHEPHEAWADLQGAMAMMRRSGRMLLADVTLADMKRYGGHVIGQAEIADCVRKSDSPWFVGECGIVLRDVHPITPFPFKGALGLFDIPHSDGGAPVQTSAQESLFG
ncbi:conserved hypothetical protein [Candidatus Koribacter versatilis Ellin345]|uniref:ASCH domain-containing protein n=1 Tax=Koribacter versatilis (strain Ellin345) TaxID=204669 RepID=Q1ILS2_KORVE|nr:ASCH domain-containing protein [Candidatus Koribacter versatilis]ABF42178.1 conserved hypothetical protein [Candidatus Koribacter versatilis Ellin345]